MKKNKKPEITQSIISNFLEGGKGKLAKLERIKKITVPYNGTNAFIYISPDVKGGNTKLLTETYKPFMYTKKIDFSTYFKKRTIEVKDEDIDLESNSFRAICLIDNKKKTYFFNNHNKYLGTVKNYDRKHICEMFLPNISQRKKYFKRKLSEYNIIQTKTIDTYNGDKCERIENGFNNIFTILKKKKDTFNASSNPLFKWKSDGKMTKIKGSFSDLTNFFKEGGIDIRERHGIYFNSNKLQNLWDGFSEKEKIDFYYKTRPFLLKKKECLDLEGLMVLNGNQNKLIKFISQKYEDDLKIYLDNQKLVYTDEQISFEDLTDVKYNFDSDVSGDLNNFQFLGDNNTLYVYHKKFDAHVTNSIGFFSGVEQFLNIKNIKEIALNEIKKIKSKITENGYKKVIFDLISLSEIFDKQDFELIKKSISNQLVGLEVNSNISANFTKSNLFRYVNDVIGYDKFLDDVIETNTLNIDIDTDFISPFTYGKDKAFSLQSTGKGRAFFDMCEKYNFDIFDVKKSQCLPISPTQQFMIQTGARCFRGMQYSDLNILTLDIETRGNKNEIAKGNGRAALSSRTGEIFQIGLYSEGVVQTVYHADNHYEEKNIIEKTYADIARINPDVVLTYHGEGFDFPFMEERLEILGGLKVGKYDTEATVKSYIKEIGKNNTTVEIEEGTYINDYYQYVRNPAKVKVGGGTEDTWQTEMLGINFIDALHQVKKASAINTKIPNHKLKDNIIYSGVAKPNRVYVEGNKIGFIGSDTRPYYYNEKTGKYFVNEIKIKGIDYDDKLIKIDENGDKYYKNKNELFCFRKNEKTTGKFLKCDNIFDLSFEGNNSSVDKKFDSLYDLSKSYDVINFFKTSYTKGYDNSGYIQTKLNKLKKDSTNLKELFTTFDFTDYKIVSGKTIIERYLIDDLWETAKLAEIHLQSSFLLCDWMVENFQRVSTMGYASMWKLLMVSWSYHHNVTLPDYDVARKINGGLIGLTKSGYCEDVVKIDASSLYPSVLLAYLKPPSWDISGITNEFVRFTLETRLKYKKLKNEYAAKGEQNMAKQYDLLQLPLKILINSFYGFFGANNISPFADMKSAHMITATSRQVARHLIRWFEVRGFVCTYSHTDGVNFIFPKNVNDYNYTSNGENWLNKKGKIYNGIEGYVAQYNDLFMPDRMGMDIDDILTSCANFAKSNFISLKKKNKKDDKGNVYTVNSFDVVGGFLKKDTSKFIRKFSEKDAPILLENEVDDFLESYYDYINKIWNYDIKAGDIASFQKLNRTLDEYANMTSNQASYELVKKNKLHYDTGDLFFWINTGIKEDDSDFSEVNEKLGSITLTDDDNDLFNILNINKNNQKSLSIIQDKILNDLFTFNKKRIEGELVEKTFLLDKWFDYKKISLTKKTKSKKIIVEENGEKIKKTITFNQIEIGVVYNQFNCQHLTPDDYDSKGIKYNRIKYLTAFLKAVENLMTVFNPSVREKIFYSIKKYVKKSYKVKDDNVYYTELFSLREDDFLKENITKKEYDVLIEENIITEDVKYSQKTKWGDIIDYTSTNLNLLKKSFIFEEVNKFDMPLLFDEDKKLINGIPLKDKEGNQQTLESLMEVTPIEKELWYDNKLSPNYPFDGIELKSSEYFLDSVNDNWSDVNKYSHNIVLNRKGIIDYLSNRPLVEIDEMDMSKFYN